MSEIGFKAALNSFGSIPAPVPAMLSSPGVASKSRESALQSTPYARAFAASLSASRAASVSASALRTTVSSKRDSHSRGSAHDFAYGKSNGPTDLSASPALRRGSLSTIYGGSFGNYSSYSAQSGASNATPARRKRVDDFETMSRAPEWQLRQSPAPSSRQFLGDIGELLSGCAGVSELSREFFCILMVANNIFSFFSSFCVIHACRACVPRSHRFSPDHLPTIQPKLRFYCAKELAKFLLTKILKILIAMKKNCTMYPKSGLSDRGC
jgi:hypothetical protein